MSDSHEALLTWCAATLAVLGTPDIHIEPTPARPATKRSPGESAGFYLFARETCPADPDPPVEVHYSTHHGGGVRILDGPSWAGVLATYTAGMSVEAFTAELRETRDGLVRVWHDDQAGLF